MFENYNHKFSARGKIIYVPNERCVRKGNRIIDHINKTISFPEYFYHYSAGGHVSALRGGLPEAACRRLLQNL